MSKADFEAKQAYFIAVLAASFGASVSLIHIQSVAEVVTRHLPVRFSARRLLSTAVSVSCTVETSNRVEQSSLSQQLVAFGFPSPTSIDIMYPSGQLLSSTLSTSNPAHDDNLTTSSASSGGLLPVVIGAVCGGGGLVVVLLGMFFWYRTRQLRQAARRETAKLDQVEAKKRQAENAKPPTASAACVYPHGITLATNKHMEDGISDTKLELKNISKEPLANELLPSSIELKSKLGQGGIGSVFSADWFDKQVAVKQFTISCRSSQDMFKQEVSIISKLEHVSIIGFLGVVSDSQSVDKQGKPLGICIVMELASYGSLLDIFRNLASFKALQTKKELYRFLTECSQGLDHLHSMGIIHRDIKPGNILVGNNFKAKIADFGISCIEASSTVADLGTVNYMAPEIFEGEVHSFASDVFSFGLVFWFVVTATENNGKGIAEPWQGNERHEIRNNVIAGKRPEWSSVAMSNLASWEYLMRETSKCWEHDPALRPAMRDLVQRLYLLMLSFPDLNTSTKNQTVAQELTKNEMIPIAIPSTIYKHAKKHFQTMGTGHGLKVCSLQLELDLPDELVLLKRLALNHVRKSSPFNQTFEDRFVVKQLLVINKHNATISFSENMVALSARAHPEQGWVGPGPFMRNWDQKSFQRSAGGPILDQSDEEILWRQKLLALLGQQYPTLLEKHPLCPWSQAFTGFHACDGLDTASKICQTGFAQLATTDEGWFGQGLYFTLDLDYAVQAYGKPDSSGCFTVLVCDLALGNVYPVIEAPKDPRPGWSLLGRPSVPKYDAHLVGVDQIYCGVPCPPRHWVTPKHKLQLPLTELVLFESNSILPRFVLSLQPKLP